MSDLLNKFANVKVDTATRISPQDAAYCEGEQANYNRAHKLYTEFRNSLTEAMTLESEEWTSRTGKGASEHCSWAYCESYGDGGLDDIDKRIDEIQANFIHGLKYYFSDKYNISLESETIDANLGFKKPEHDWRTSNSTWESALEEYRIKSTRLLNYNEVVDEILLQLGGLTFANKAVQQVKDNAKEATHNKYHNITYFTIKKKVIQFHDGFSHWTEQHRAVLLALLHFDTGLTSMAGTYWQREFDIYYSYYNDYNDDKRVGSAYEFEGQKVCKMRYFKSGRWDVTFALPELAGTFAREYLGY